MISANLLDLANHHPDSTEEQIKTLCEKVIKYGFNAAFVNPCYIEFAKKTMGKDKKVGTVISFPLGQETLEIKKLSAKTYAFLGADELDVSLNVGYLKMEKWDKSLEEMKVIINEAKSIRSSVIVKFIPETGYLTTEEIKKTAALMVTAGADFFKTCSGLGPRGALVEDVLTIREAVGKQIKIKVAGGITTFKEAELFIKAGADRIGTSHGVEIITEASQNP
ncbi:deoxyribose-phosphate aldolase [Candidatus Gottesmanbacteria bacterium]|nr:deoxyribose-phosphate aldolase [Candidatus Gottesmanbacteria bacterium]